MTLRTERDIKILKIAVIGLGRAGWQMHIPEINRHPRFELIAAVDPLPRRLEEARREFGVKGYPDCATLFAKEKPDVVVIASPTQFHPEQTVASSKRAQMCSATNRWRFLWLMRTEWLQRCRSTDENLWFISRTALTLKRLRYARYSQAISSARFT